MTIVLQRFTLRLDDPSYTLKIAFNLTIKPKDLYIRATLRNGLDATSLDRALNASQVDTNGSFNGGSVQTPPGSIDGADRNILVLYGSNTGTCEALARKLAVDAKRHGFIATISSLDAAVDSLPTDRPVIILSSSYEGQPPDNAVHFVEWLRRLSDRELSGAQFAVFGCGHRRFYLSQL